MTDLFVAAYVNQIVVTDADSMELWRGSSDALPLLRALRDAGVIGLYEEEAKEIYYLCPSCAAETTLEPGVWRCSGCGKRLPVEMLPDLDRYIP